MAYQAATFILHSMPKGPHLLSARCILQLQRQAGVLQKLRCPKRHTPRGRQIYTRQQTSTVYLLTQGCSCPASCGLASGRNSSSSFRYVKPITNSPLPMFFLLTTLCVVLRRSKCRVARPIGQDSKIHHQIQNTRRRRQRRHGGVVTRTNRWRNAAVTVYSK